MFFFFQWLLSRDTGGHFSSISLSIAPKYVQRANRDAFFDLHPTGIESGSRYKAS